ncbi:hypothetical protein L1887_58830 [Cichorium endivia]|nr:hypothetical protein L1887_58830 [Cichorium endivia]
MLLHAQPVGALLCRSARLLKRLVLTTLNLVQLLYHSRVCANQGVSSESTASTSAVSASASAPTRSVSTSTVKALSRSLVQQPIVIRPIPHLPRIQKPRPGTFLAKLIVPLPSSLDCLHKCMAEHVALKCMAGHVALSQAWSTRVLLACEHSSARARDHGRAASGGSQSSHVELEPYPICIGRSRARRRSGHLRN